MIVAVLDSGVRVPHPHLPAVAECVAIDPAFGDGIDRLGHGTAVASAIHDIAPGATLIVGKIFDRSLATNVATLTAGIEWAASRGARLINLSLGTTNAAHESLLREAVDAAAAVNAIIVSACEVNGVACLPGSLTGVIGVDADPTLEREEIIATETGYRAAPYPRPIPGVPKDRNLSGISFAVANVTGLLARMIEAESAIWPDLRSK